MDAPPTPPRDAPDAPTTVVAIIGDVVTSRDYADEADLLAGLRDALAGVERAVPGRQPLTLGGPRDEFHGTHQRIGDAVRATLRLRLATDELVLPTTHGTPRPVELRLGLGIGSPPPPGPRPGGGSAWRHAADARADAQALPARRGWPPSLRSRCRADDPVLAAALNAHLLLQDQLLARLDARDRRALLGLLDGERQVDVATTLGISQPAVARRLRDRGGLALHRALLELDTLDRSPDARDRSPDGDPGPTDGTGAAATDRPGR